MRWEPGMKVVHRAQRGWGVGVVIQVGDDGRRLAVRFAGRDGVTVVSGRDPALTAVPLDTPIEEVGAAGPMDALAAGQAGGASSFRLRAMVARLEALRRADSLGALLSSRVHVLPYQVGAAGRILADRAPRFVLADEVGLGKTVEAGLVFAGLRQLGLAERVLVIVPEHLAFQWLAELFHKFNALFTLLTAERIEELGGPEAALARSPLAIVSQERLRADDALVDAACELPLDLVVVDEAHHLADDALHDAVEPIAKAAFGCLLLTATPVRLDPREYFRLLALVEPVPTASLDAFLARLARHERHAEVARALLAGGDPAAARARLAELEPDDPAFEADGPADRGALLAHLADRYSLSSRLIRNRRAKVGAFTERVLRRLDVAAGEKLEATARLCVELAGQGEKVLVFAGDPALLAAAQAAVARLGKEALLYDEAGTIEARDRLVARFRDPDGPMILLCGESGGEGRNFQFASHLVCLDLPDSPLTLEQRIGRLDRLGQHRPVEIHVPCEPGDDAFLAGLYEQEIGIFAEPVGGLDAVLASLPAELAALREKPAKAREKFRRALAERVAEGRRAQHEGYDPILDLRSASLPELSRLVGNAYRRLGEAAPADPAAGADAAQEALLALSRSLEEQLEDACADVARRVGVDVDTDQNVHPFEVAFTLGAHLRIEALPGMEIPDDPVTHLGSFWRETAVARDELEWFATGHRLVEALLGLVRDGEVGRTAAFRSAAAPRRGALYTRWQVVWPAPADVEPGARVPSRQASRYLEAAPIALAVDLAEGNRLVPGLSEELEGEEGAEEARVGAVPPPLLEAARLAAERAAQGELARRREEALAALAAHAEAEEERLVTAAFEGGAEREAVEAALRALRRHRAVTEAALGRTRLELDAAALVVPA
ncbi:SNF2-related protein [Anaeromyxobacter diazotrophicus]|uniref:RNA polymerase-associated protein RapA n=1 Tax=Anaeromyxobacter diazotrophicus TaxID=2590199 RepID=A0A7I9VH42_9BACT|nr:SNF2-related protein [Anaeromyxobacter diazotrophicus]GEJ55711.1 RNA polymerase-associated protein RapA [Anaeromyxobacter diazotrophicus]